MPRSRVPGAAWTAVLGALTLPLAALAAIHALGDDRGFVLATIHGTIGWTLVPAAPLAAAALLSGRRRIGALAAAVAALHFVWVAPGHLARPGPAPPDAVRIGSANLLSVHRHPEREVRAVLDLDADVWCLQELSSRYADLLSLGEPAARWPHRWLAPDGDSSFGIGVVSRVPLADAWTEDLLGVPMVVAVLGGDGPAAGITLVCVHTVPPRTPGYTRQWSAQMDALAHRVAALDGPVVVAGDLNATRHHPSYRRLLATAGLRDAHAEVGRASARTWPAPPYWRFLPKLRLDHVLLSDGLRAFATEEGRPGGSDHLPLAAVVGRGDSSQRREIR